METQIEIGGRRIGRFRASVLLFKETVRFLMLDKEMVLVPIIAFIFEVMLFVLLVLLFLFTGTLEALQAQTSTALSGGEMIALFALYVLSAYSIAWAQAVIAHIVYVRSHGGNATLTEGMSRAWGRTFDLLFWSVITSTVGIILRSVSERSKLIGRVISALLGATWSVLTYFVVPSMMIGNRSALESVRDSASVFRRTWGETLITNVSFSILFMIAMILCVLGILGIGFAVGWSLSVVSISILVFVCVTFAFALLASILGSILRTLLYIYASEGSVPENFNRELLEHIIVRQHETSQSRVPGSGTSFV